VEPEPGARILGFCEEPEPEAGAGKISYLAPGSLAPYSPSPQVDVSAEFGRQKKKIGKLE